MLEQAENKGKFNSDWGGGELFEKQRRKEINDIVEFVNGTDKYQGAQRDDIIATTDIEGDPKSFLCKLKAGGMIDSVSFDNETDRLKIELNKDWRGALAFCGDLTSYKGFRFYDQGIEEFIGNEIVIEVFEELLEQLEEHNEQIIKRNRNKSGDQPKEEEAKFVAVPGNHEFLRYCGYEDMLPFMGEKRGESKGVNKDLTPQHALKVKVRAARVIAKIQKYYFEQALRNGYDIQDNDYSDRYGDAFASLTRYINELDDYISDCETLLKNIDDAKEWETISKQLEDINNEYDNKTKEFEVWEEEADLGLLNVLKLRHNKLFSKMILNHRGKKLRLLHSLTLFAPTDKFSSRGDRREWYELQRSYIGRYYKLNPEFSDNINYNLSNIGGIDNKYFRDKEGSFDPSVFDKNAIPTIWGHTGELLEPDGQQVCIDNKNRRIVFNDYSSRHARLQYLFYIDQEGQVFCLQVRDGIHKNDNSYVQELEPYCTLKMPTAKTIIDRQDDYMLDDQDRGEERVINFQNNNNVQNNSQSNREINQSHREINQHKKEQLAENIITAIINGDDATLEGLRQQFYRSHIDNDFLILALRDYNGKNHNVIKRYSWGEKFWSLGEATARRRRINHLGKMLNGCFTKNMNKRRKQQYQQAIQRYNQKTKPSVAQMNSISFDNLLSIAKIRSRWRCGCCGRGSVEVRS